MRKTKNPSPLPTSVSMWMGPKFLSVKGIFNRRSLFVFFLVLSVLLRIFSAIPKMSAISTTNSRLKRPCSLRQRSGALWRTETSFSLRTLILWRRGAEGAVAMASRWTDRISLGGDCLVDLSGAKTVPARELSYVWRGGRSRDGRASARRRRSQSFVSILLGFSVCKCIHSIRCFLLLLRNTRNISSWRLRKAVEHNF